MAVIVDFAAGSFSCSFSMPSSVRLRGVAPAELRRGNFAIRELMVAILTLILSAAAVVQFVNLAVAAATTATGDRAGRRGRWPVGRSGRRGDADSCP